MSMVRMKALEAVEAQIPASASFFFVPGWIGEGGLGSHTKRLPCMDINADACHLWRQWLTAVRDTPHEAQPLGVGCEYEYGYGGGYGEPLEDWAGQAAKARVGQG